MKKQKHYTFVLILVFSGLTVFCQAPAHAQLWRLNDQLTIRQNENTIIINRNLTSQNRHVNELMRGSDLSRAIRDMMFRIRDSIAILKGRRMDQFRANEISRISESNAQDTIRRNKMIHQIQKASQRALIRDLKSKSRDLNQRIKDQLRR